MPALRDSLDGWWHAYFDSGADWQAESGQAGEPSLLPTGGWHTLDEFKESVPVPGTWRDRRPGFQGVVWYQRPLMLPDDWQPGITWLELIGIRSRAQVYLDECQVGMCASPNGDCLVELGFLAPQKLYSLAIRVWHPDDTGGISESVTLVQDLSEKA